MKLLYVLPVLLGLGACDIRPIYTVKEAECSDKKINVDIYKDYVVVHSEGKSQRLNLIKQSFKESNDISVTNIYEQNLSIFANSSKNGIGITLDGEKCGLKADKIDKDELYKDMYDSLGANSVIITDLTVYIKGINHRLVKKIFVDRGIVFKDRDLYDAADIGDLKKVKELVANGYDVNYVCKDTCENWTPVMIASANGHLDVVKFLLGKGANPNAQNKMGRTAIAFATRYKIKPVVEALLESGADPTIESQDKGIANSAMAEALVGSISDEDSYDILKMLIYKTGKVNAEFWDYTPLMMAVSYDDYDFAKYLLDKGADVNHTKSIKQEDGSVVEYTIKELAKSQELRDLIDLYVVPEEDYDDDNKSVFKNDGIEALGYTGIGCFMVPSGSEHPDMVISRLCKEAELVNTGEWLVRFQHGLLKGESYCGDDVNWENYEKKKADLKTYAEALNLEGECWCRGKVLNISLPDTKIDISIENSDWVSRGEMNCTQCPIMCGGNIMYDESLRREIIGGMGLLKVSGMESSSVASEQIDDFSDEANDFSDEMEEAAEKMNKAMKTMGKGLTEAMGVMIERMKNIAADD